MSQITPPTEANHVLTNDVEASQPSQISWLKPWDKFWNRKDQESLKTALFDLEECDRIDPIDSNNASEAIDALLNPKSVGRDYFGQQRGLTGIGDMRYGFVIPASVFPMYFLVLPALEKLSINPESFIGASLGALASVLLTIEASKIYQFLEDRIRHNRTNKEMAAEILKAQQINQYLRHKASINEAEDTNA